MHDLAAPFASSHICRELVADFLMAFSRFEYALKRSGYGKQEGNLLRVEWRRFATDCGRGRDAQTSVGIIRRDAKYLIDKPPRRQKREGDALTFDDVETAPPEPSLTWLLEKTYVVRNNLFHGGKWWPVDEPARNEKLLESALCVLRGSLRLHERAEDFYFQSLD